MTSITDRVAGAPISWGVCEVPGWGLELPAERVLREMQALGLTATELGPDGYLPTEPSALVDLLDRHGLQLIAGFVPAVLHCDDPRGALTATVGRAVQQLAAAGAETLVVAATSGRAGYEHRPELDDAAWDLINQNLTVVDELASAAGLAVAVHPHAGTVIERHDEVYRLLEETTVNLCVDTGHLMVGGADPLEVVRRAGERVRHVHLKDVDLGLVEGVRSHQIGYEDAVQRGLYQPLGRGNAPVAPTVMALEQGGYQGWYVLEQDVRLPAEAAPDEVDPAVDVAASIEFLRRTERQLAGG